MEDRDWSQERGVADEASFNEFVVLYGGELIAPRIERQNIKNADYLFPAAKIVGEHKFLEADFAQSPETVEKVDAVFAKYAGEDLTVETHPAYRELFSILRTPMRRRIEKANKQIKGAKKELGLIDHRGIVFLVNDNFRSAPPGPRHGSHSKRSGRKGPLSRRRRGHLHYQPLCRDCREPLGGPPLGTRL